MFLFLCWLCFLQDSCCQATEFLPGEIELVAHLLTLLSIQLFELGGSSAHASVGPIGDGRDHLQIAQQFLEGRARCPRRSEEHTSELQSQSNLVCRLLLEKKKKKTS